MPAWFIRFAGCNLSCPWCDTDCSEKMEYTEIDIFEEINNNQYHQCKNVILTGGEPTLQNLLSLCKRLKCHGYYIAIETNGTHSLQEYGHNKHGRGLLNWVTVSPKERPLRVNCEIDELKIIWPSPIFQWCNSLKADYYYLQPCDNKNKEVNTKEAIDIVKQNPKWRLSLQMQKVINVR